MYIKFCIFFYLKQYLFHFRLFSDFTNKSYSKISLLHNDQSNNIPKVLFTCNWGTRFSVTLTVGIEFFSINSVSVFAEQFWDHSNSFFEQSCIILSCIADSSKFVWIQRLSDSPRYSCSVFSVYFLVKGSITSHYFTCNSCSCFKIDRKSFHDYSILKLFQNLMEVTAWVCLCQIKRRSFVKFMNYIVT